MIEYIITLSLLQKPSWGTHTPVDYSLLTDAQHCEQMGRLIAMVEPRLPEMIDATTREDGMSLNCEERLVAIARSIRADLSALREDWRPRKQAEWDEEVCRDPIFGVLARRGWRFTQNLTFQSGERTSMDAHCPPQN